MILGSLSALAGILLLAHVWQGGNRRPRRRHQLLRATALGLLAFAVVLIADATGPARAVAIALLIMMLTAALILAPLGWQAWRARRTAAERIPAVTSPRPDAPTVARVVWIALLAGPVSGIATIATAAALGHLATGWSPADRVGFVTVLAPLLWALLAVFATYAATLYRRTLIITGTLGTALALAWLSMGGAS